ncbi:MAG: hypothetical protein ACRCX4_02225 [Bacteroidales bacterium]
MKNIWKLGVFVVILLTVVVVRSYMLSPSLSAEVADLMKNLSGKTQIAWNIFDSRDVMTPEYHVFGQVRQLATDEEVMQLTKSLEPHVRVYGVMIASERETVDKYSLLVSHLKDAAEVDVKSDDKCSRRKVGDFYVHFLYPSLSETEKNKIDSTILYDKTNKLICISDVMNRLSPQEAHYPRIREIYNKERRKDALEYLARYQQEQDVNLIMSELKRSYSTDVNRALRAVEVFPNPVFLPVLLDMYSQLQQKELHDAVDVSLLFKALINYELIKVYALLKNSVIRGDQDFGNTYAGILKDVIASSGSSFYQPLCKHLP